ncbi:MAG TPA: hypothetical protein VML36_05870 [Nitrospiria bacterium]|nr:hypothetical protein [Nitrospiria bacterium]
MMSKDITLRRETIVTVPALLVIAAAIPRAIVGTIETGRVYLFLRRFLEELPRRFHRDQDVFASSSSRRSPSRSGRAEAWPMSRPGDPPFLIGLVFNAGSGKMPSSIRAHTAPEGRGDEHMA